ncbi:MAG: SapC family protein [Desulfobacterales bacterium]|nr:SapC family protein [Desulfobacterales bacterium]
MAQNIYQKPIYLNSVNHKFVKVAPVRNYKFARESNSALIVGNDFQEAAKCFPVVFTKDPEGAIVPVAILGLKNNENLFVDENGSWRAGTYVPAYFRRYPFILAKSADQDGRFSVCVDSGYEGFGSEEGMQLFDGEGNQTEEFKKTVELLRVYQAQFDNTKNLIKILEEYQLFKEVAANITLPAGEKIGLGGLLMVNEEAMLKMEDEKALRLFRSGYLTLVYAHLSSLTNFRSLMAIANVKRGTLLTK